MRAHADASYVQLIVNEGGGAGASLEHTHAQLYALALRPGRGRARARAGRRLRRTDRRRRAARRRPGRGGAPQRAAGRDRRRGGADLPLGLALALRAADRPAARGRRASRTSGGAAMIATAMRVLAARFGGPPELNLWVRTAPARRRALPLARRHRPAADDQGRLRARHRRRHQRLPAGAGGVRPARLPLRPILGGAPRRATGRRARSRAGRGSARRCRRGGAGSSCSSPPSTARPGPASRSTRKWWVRVDLEIVGAKLPQGRGTSLLASSATIPRRCGSLSAWRTAERSMLRRGRGARSSSGK